MISPEEPAGRSLPLHGPSVPEISDIRSISKFEAGAFSGRRNSGSHGREVRGAQSGRLGPPFGNPFSLPRHATELPSRPGVMRLRSRQGRFSRRRRRSVALMRRCSRVVFGGVPFRVRGIRVSNSCSRERTVELRRFAKFGTGNDLSGCRQTRRFRSADRSAADFRYRAVFLCMASRSR